MRAPRLRTDARTLAEMRRQCAASQEVAPLVDAMRGASVLINAAGDPDASSLDAGALFGANALLPGLLLRAAHKAGIRRFVQISSAVVQADKEVLDSSEDLRPFSPYSASKVLGELLLRDPAGDLEVVRYRPPSVHAPDRRVTRMIGKIAKSPAAVVATPGTQPTPQALLPNVAAAVAYLATSEMSPPAVVHHPSEGLTVSSLLEYLSGGRSPFRIPQALARSVVVMLKALGRTYGPVAANARRVELLWFGQEQAESWLTARGWKPPVDRDGWRALAEVERR